MGSISARRSGLGAWTAAAICVVASIAGPARATLLWNDAFDLPPYLAANVNGQSGGTGTFFTGPWEGVNAADITADDQLILETSLTMPGLIEPSTGGALGDNDTTGCCITGRVGRAFATPWSGRTPPEGSFYMGFLANWGSTEADGDDPHHRVLEMWEGAWPGTGGGDNNRNLMLGYTTFAGLGSNLSMMMKDGTGAGQALVKELSPQLQFANDGRTHFVVLKFELSNSASDRVSVFLDPVGLVEPGTPSAQFAGADYTDGSLDVTLDRMGGIVQFSFTGAEVAGKIDQLKIATTFAEVARLQIPEPAALGLGSIAALALAMVRRRRG